MKPSEYASIVFDVQNAFKEWCKENNADSGKIEEGKGISTYIENSLDAYVEHLSGPQGESLTQISFEKYRDETFKMILTLLSSYSGKEIKTMDEDDGIVGEKSEMRHQIFDGTFGTVAATKSGVVGKEKVARAYRALADFFETLWDIYVPLPLYEE